LQLIVFIHGIGNFNPTDNSKVEMLHALQTEADKIYGPEGSQVVYISYQSLLQAYPVTKLVEFTASIASMMLFGVPQIGYVLMDYLTDITQYFLYYSVRRDVSNSVVSQLASYLSKNKGQIDGITLLGHSLGSLVVLRLTALLMAHGSHTKLGSELLHSSSQLQADVTNIAKLPISVAILGSPAFSSIKTIGLATRKMALAESPLDQVLKDHFLSTKTQIINLWSKKDPLSGPASNDYCHNILDDTGHSNIETPFQNLMAYMKTLREVANATTVEKTE